MKSLRASKVHLPAGELAAELQTSPATIQKRMTILREAGFDIDERPGLGFRLVSAPDRLIADDLYSRLGTSMLVREILVLAETTSTNDRANDFARRGAPGGTAVLAEFQTAGRGRFGRRWESTPYAGIWCSLLLRPHFMPALWPRLTTWTALAIADAIEETAGVAVAIKWPNDLVIAGRKVAGILIETGEDEAQRRFAVVGFGINVNQTASDFSDGLAENAGSLRQLTGRPLDRAALTVAIFRAMETRLAQVETRFSAMVQEASCRSTILGRWVRVRVGGQLWKGWRSLWTARGAWFCGRGQAHHARSVEVKFP
ncbi:MAG TPA: biotin--[acetyl-CoA-carboxylase] ligase [Chthoniobacteraceae bacterium]|nr:biotin--[acetyl-CoA-carboxylase] ligase [Chthoniobacteraceae bacterium]